MKEETYRLTPKGMFVAVLLKHGIIKHSDDRIEEAWDDFADYCEKYFKDDLAPTMRLQTCKEVLLELFPALGKGYVVVERDYCVRDFFDTSCLMKDEDCHGTCDQHWNSPAPDEYQD